MRRRVGALAATLIAGKLALIVAAAVAFGGVADLCQFDCNWYMHIASGGYDEAPRLMDDSDATNHPFYPLYPLSIRAFMALGLTPLTGGLLAASLASLAFLLVAVRYRAATRPGRDGTRFVLAVLLFPWSIYLSLPYTEALYAAVVVALLLAEQRRAAVATGALAGLLTATRPTGVLLLPYLVVTALWRGRAVFRLRPPGRWGALADLLFPLALMPLGLALFMAYMAWLTGDALASSHALAPWGRHLENPLRMFYWNLASGDWRLLLREEGPDSRAFSVAWGVPAALGCAWLLWRRLPLEAWTLGITTVVALSAGSESVTRYIAANPVFLLLVGDLADRIRPRWLLWSAGLLALLLQAVLLHRWLLGSRMMM